MTIAYAQGKEFDFPEGTTSEQMGTAIDEFFSGQELADPQPSAKQPSVKETGDESLQGDVNAALMNIPGVPALAEFAAGANRSVAGFLDFLGPDQVNSILEIGGSDKRVPTLRESIPGIEGGTMELGMARDIVAATGEVSPAALGTVGMLKTLASKLPAFAPTESVGTGMLRTFQPEIAATPKAVHAATAATIGEELALSGASAAGSEFGEELAGGETGKLIGGVLAPVGVGAAYDVTKGIINMTKESATSLISSLNKLSDEGAAEVLGSTLVRSGMSPEDVERKLIELGGEGMLADVSVNFSRLLKEAANKIPQIEGRAIQVSNARQQSRDPRVMEAFEDATGTPSVNADDQLRIIEETTMPRVTELYNQARSGDISLSGNLIKMLDNTDTSLGKARLKANQRIIDKKAQGKDAGTFTIIDETKRELDDQIGEALRKGKNAKAGDLIEFKNMMVKEADESVPAYKEARDMFAGVKELESAIDMGRDFLKISPRQMVKYFDGLGESEKQLFRLGAKDAIIDKLDATQLNSDAIKQMFGKGGSAEKLKKLFADDDSYQRFSKAMEREANFVMTRQAIQGNSSTLKQALDAGQSSRLMDAAEAVTGGPLQWTKKLGQILNGVSKQKGTQANDEALQKAGDILLDANMKPETVADILRRGNRAEINNQLKKAATRIRKLKGVTAVIGQETRQEKSQKE